MPNYEVPTLNKDIYQNDPSKPLGTEDILAYVSDRPLEYVPYQGIILHIQGATYPKKGFPMPESVAAINIIKTILLQATKFPLTLLLVNKNKLLTTFNQVFDRTFSPYKLSPEYLCPTAYNFHKVVSNFLLELGYDITLSVSFSYNLAHVLEYDDAYRYRLQDILSETTHEALTTNTNQEIKRLVSILEQRTPKGNDVANKIKRLLTPIQLLLLIPHYRKAFKKALTHTILKGMQYDPADKYWAQLKGDDYLFTGLPYEERTRGLAIPQAVKVNY
jgi:hypothetical protein